MPVDNVNGKGAGLLFKDVLRCIERNWVELGEKPTAFVELSRKYNKRALRCGLGIGELVDQLEADGQVVVLVAIAHGKRWVLPAKPWAALGEHTQVLMRQQIKQNVNVGLGFVQLTNKVEGWQGLRLRMAAEAGVELDDVAE